MLPLPDPAGALGGAGVALLVAFAVVGLLVAVVGAVVVRRARAAGSRRRRLMGSGVRATADVVGTQQSSHRSGDDGSRTLFRPVVAFRTASGDEVRTVAAPLTTVSWLEGTRVQLVHDPADPERAEVLEPLAGPAVREGGAVVLVVGAVVGLGGLATAAAALVALLGR